ncbi:MAG: tetratricopeptide repeat protein [Patescibacteria group bacterium]
MILDFTAIGVIIACLAIVVLIISKKFPIIAAIDTENLAKHKQDKVKSDLMEERLKRKLDILNVRKYFPKKNGEPTRSPLVLRMQTFLKNLEKRYQKKIDEVDEDMVTADKNKLLILNEAKTLVEQDKEGEAEQKYIEAISLDTHFEEAYHGLADLYLKKKDYDHAKEIFSYLIKLNAHDDASYEHLGLIAKSQGNLAEAEKDYLQSISLNNQVAGYHADLGEVYRLKGEHDKSLRHFLEALKLEPNNPRYLDEVISVAIVLNNGEVARRYYEKLKEVNPENKKLNEYKKALGKLA